MKVLSTVLAATAAFIWTPTTIADDELHDCSYTMYGITEQYAGFDNWELVVESFSTKGTGWSSYSECREGAKERVTERCNLNADWCTTKNPTTINSMYMDLCINKGYTDACSALPKYGNY